MSVAAGTWRQGGLIRGSKETSRVFDPRLAEGQTPADRQTRRAELIEELILNGCSDFGIQGELGSDPVGWMIDALNFLPKKLHEAWRSPTQAAEERETGRVQLHELADAVPGVGYRDIAHRYVDNLNGRRLDRFIAQATAARNGATIREAAPGLEQSINVAVGLSMIAAGAVGSGTVQRLSEGDPSHPSPDGNTPKGPDGAALWKALTASGIAAWFISACERLFGEQELPTVEVTKVTNLTATPEASETPMSTMTPTPSATPTETPTFIPTETPIVPLSASISAETIGDGTVLFPIMRQPLPPELSTFIPVDGKLGSGGGELTGLSGVKLCLGVESDETCYGVSAPAPEFLSRHLDGRVVTYRHDRDASQDGVQIYTTGETGEGIAPQQVFINRVPMRPGLHFETVIRDGSDQNDPGAGQLLMMWINSEGLVIESLARVRDFDSNRGDDIDIDYTNGVVRLTTFANNTKRVEEFAIGKPPYPTATPRPEPTRTPIPRPTETPAAPMTPTPEAQPTVSNEAPYYGDSSWPTRTDGSKTGRAKLDNGLSSNFCPGGADGYVTESFDYKGNLYSRDVSAHVANVQADGTIMMRDGSSYPPGSYTLLIVDHPSGAIKTLGPEWLGPDDCLTVSTVDKYQVLSPVIIAGLR